MATAPAPATAAAAAAAVSAARPLHPFLTLQGLERAKAAYWMQATGAAFSSSLDKQVTHLLLTDPTATGPKVDYARYCPPRLEVPYQADPGSAALPSQHQLVVVAVAPQQSQPSLAAGHWVSTCIAAARKASCHAATMQLLSRHHALDPSSHDTNSTCLEATRHLSSPVHHHAAMPTAIAAISAVSGNLRSLRQSPQSLAISAVSGNLRNLRQSPQSPAISGSFRNLR
jgi:hypothetical protein